MSVKCDICGEPMTDGDRIPMFIVVSGFDIGGRQKNVEVCPECLLSRSDRILELLETGEYR